MEPYPGPCLNTREPALWMAAGPISQQTHFLGSSELLGAAGLWGMLGAKGQAEHAGCCCGVLNDWLQSLSDSHTTDLTGPHV